MSSVENALKLAALGFYVFPVVKDSKIPAITQFPERASSNPEEIKKLWEETPGDDFNIGISTSRFGKDEALLVVDIDKKDGRDGFKTLEELSSQLPHTLSQHTPSGGAHFIYRIPSPVKQGTNVLGVGVDIRSKGGYIVGPSSSINGSRYRFESDVRIAEAPEWLIQRCGPPNERENYPITEVEINQQVAERRAHEYLAKLEPATKGGRNHEGYKVAARLKDFGLPPEMVGHLISTEWKCEPLLSMGEIAAVVHSAFQYGNRQPGSDTPEAAFNVIPMTKEKSPIQVFAEKYFLLLSGGTPYVCWETTDHAGNFRLERLSVPKFHEWVADQTIPHGNKQEAISRMWVRSPEARKYQGLVFAPNQRIDSRFYNLWKGFKVKPMAADVVPAPQATAALELFLEHCFKNICQDNEELHKWLISYFAHLIQKPQEKPGVALVFKGLKGTGKNALIDRMAYLLGDSAITIADKRHMLGNFNSILENKLLVTLDEAFWSGDKQSEGILKSMITSTTKTIERKGAEPYDVGSYERVVIIGNEDWLVPATADERRFAVFNVGPGRRKDTKFFKALQEGMEIHGGAELLMRYLTEYDISEFDVRTPPHSEGLQEQKESSLSPVQQWWFDSLSNGRIVGRPGVETWPEHIASSSLYDAYVTTMRERNIGGRLYTQRALAEQLKRLSPKLAGKNIREGGQVYRSWVLLPLENARREWEQHFGAGWKWDDLTDAQDPLEALK